MHFQEHHAYSQDNKGKAHAVSEHARLKAAAPLENVSLTASE